MRFLGGNNPQKTGKKKNKNVIATRTIFIDDLSYERPTHLSPPQQMKVKVIHGLASMVTAIEHGSKPRTRNT
jgi:hypothetical protein